MNLYQLMFSDFNLTVRISRHLCSRNRAIEIELRELNLPDSASSSGNMFLPCYITDSHIREIKLPRKYLNHEVEIKKKKQKKKKTTTKKKQTKKNEH